MLYSLSINSLDESVLIRDDVASEVIENEEPEEKLTLYEEEVLKIEKMLRTGYSVRYIAKESSFSKSEIRKIKKSIK